MEEPKLGSNIGFFMISLMTSVYFGSTSIIIFFNSWSVPWTT
jgi:hypothetical protein